MGALNSLERANEILRDSIEKLKATPEKSNIEELLEAIGALDSYYKEEFCTQTDEYDGLPAGTTYNSENGIMVEFYIEADDWHRISKAYRKLVKKQSHGYS